MVEAVQKKPVKNSESSDLINQIQEIALEFPYYDTGRSQQNFKIVAMRSTISACCGSYTQEKLLCYKKRFKPLTTDSTHVYPSILTF